MPSIRQRLASARAGWNRPNETRRSPRPSTGTVPRVLRARSRLSAAPRLAGRGSNVQLEIAARSKLQLVPDWRQSLTAIGSILSVLVIGAGLIYTGVQSTKQQELTEAGQITERFARAVDQLGSAGADKLDVRLGALYSLERIMRDSAADQASIVEVLSAFIRGHARKQPPALRTSSTGPPATDIQAALTILGRRDVRSDQSVQVDLSGTDLSGAHLANADLAGAYLRGVDLSGVDLSRAHLSNANMTEADLRTAELSRADLSGANLTEADLRSAFLSETNLTDTDLASANLAGADLFGADLSHAFLAYANLSRVNLTAVDMTDANLTGANLTGADLSGAELRQARRLTTDQLRDTTFNAETRIPADIRPPAPR